MCTHCVLAHRDKKMPLTCKELVKVTHHNCSDCHRRLGEHEGQGGHRERDKITDSSRSSSFLRELD